MLLLFSQTKKNRTPEPPRSAIILSKSCPSSVHPIRLILQPSTTCLIHFYLSSARGSSHYPNACSPAKYTCSAAKGTRRAHLDTLCKQTEAPRSPSLSLSRTYTYLCKGSFYSVSPAQRRERKRRSLSNLLTQAPWARVIRVCTTLPCVTLSLSPLTHPDGSCVNIQISIEGARVPRAHYACRERV